MSAEPPDPGGDRAGMGRSDRHLPESLTRLLDAPRSSIWPTPDDRHRPRTGPSRPRVPTRAHAGLWLWAIVYNVAGAAILYALWRSMG